MSDATKTEPGHKTFKTHFIRTILSYLPVINFITAFIYAFGSKNPEGRAYGRGNLAGLVLVYVLFIAGAVVGSFFLLAKAKEFLGG
jgi:hypothetical protein